MLEIGSLVDGKYKILNVVGKGGMSVVYQAVNEKANKIWAIKEVRKDGTQNFEVVKQNLIADTDMLKRFNHPSIPSIIDVIETDDSFLIVMDYIEGNSLSKALETSGAQSQDDVIEWSKQLCDVLGYLHAQNPPIIYRDMKPANVMLKPDGNVSLIDFGTAREFKSTSVEDTTCLGTQGYAAPEQYGGHGQTDPRTDIYCLGATMYHLITGHNPSTPPYEMYPIRYWNPMLSSGLEEIITKCTQRNPDDRYQSCAELLYALDHFQDLDIENKKVQNLKWKTFIASFVLFLVMLVATFGLKLGSNAALSNNFNSHIDSAKDLAANGKYSEAVNEYKEAIKVDPSKIDAYQAVLDLYMRDSVLDEGEYSDFIKIIPVKEDGLADAIKDANGNNIKTHKTLVSADKEKFAMLAKDLGDDLFFCYGGGDNGISIARTTIIDFRNAPKGADAKGNMTFDFRGAFDSINSFVDTLNPDDNIALAVRGCRTISDMMLNMNDKFVGSVKPEEYTALLKKLQAKLTEIGNNATYKSSTEFLEDYYNDAVSNVNKALANGLGKTSSVINGKAGG